MAYKVLMFGWEFPPQLNGGLGVACHGLTKSLSKIKSLEITLVLPKKMEVDKTVERFVFADQVSESSGTIKTISINSILEPYSNYDVYSSTYEQIKRNVNSPVIYGQSLFEEVYRYAQAASAIAHADSYDIIHAHDWLTIPSALEAKKAINKPFVLHIHATEVDRTGGHVDQRIYDIERLGMEAADKIIAVSQHTKNTIIQHYGVNEDKIQVIHNGIDYESFKHSKVCDDTFAQLNRLKKEGYQIVLFVGRLTMQKGVEYLLQAAQKVVENKPKTLFIIAGQGELQNKLISMSASMGISQNIIFTGWVQGGKRMSLYKVADLFIMPSVSEPFGLVSLEAAAYHTPIILSKTSGAREIIKNAIQTDFWDADHTAEMIFSVLEYEPLHKLLTQATYQEARDATWDKAAHALEQTYLKVMN